MRALRLVVLLVAVLATAARADDSEEARARWDALIEKGETLLDAGDHEAAADVFARAAEVARANDLSPTCDRYALYMRIQCLAQIHDMPAIRDTSLRLLTVQQEIHEQIVSEGDGDAVHESALEIADTLMDIGHANAYLGDLRTAVETLHGALEIALEWKDDECTAATLARLADAEHVRGRLGPAQAAAEAAEGLLVALATRDRVSLYMVLAKIHRTRHDLQRAHAYLERGREALDAWPEAPPVLRAHLEGQVGQVLLEQGDRKGARASLIRSRDLHAAAGQPFEAGLAQLALADAELEAHDPDAALALLETPLIEASEDRFVPLRASITRGSALTMAGRAEAGVAEFTRALALARDIGSHADVSRALEVVAGAHLEAGAHAKAQEAVLEALDLVDGMSARLTPLAEREVRHGHRSLFELAVRVGIEQSKAEEALRLIERARGSALIQQLGGPDGMLENAELAVRAGVRDARDRLVSARDGLRRAHTGNDRKALRRAVEAYDLAQKAYAETLERSRRAQLVSIRGLLEEDADTASLAGRELTALRRVLARGEVYVAYAESKGRLRAIVVDAEEQALRNLGSAEEIQTALERFKHEIARIEALRRKGDSVVESTDSRAQAARVRAILIGGLRLPADTKRIIVSPGLGMASIPLGLLTDLEIEVAVVPSAAVLEALRRRDGERGTGVLAVGDPTYRTALPDTPASVLVATRSLHGRSTLARIEYTRDEVEAITAPGDVKLLGKDASEDGLLDRLGTKRWRSVHLACHGLLDPDRPEWSSLALTPTAASDGFLSVLEVLGLDVRADAVVLSACETGRGTELAGDGMLSLATAFLGAGAPRVVASLWQVDDEATSVLMKRFYDLWRPDAGLGAAEALRQAQAHVRTTKDGKWAHPYFWAGWVLWGLPE